MESDSSHSLVSRQFSNQYVWLRYKKNKNLRWNIYNTEMFRKEAVGLEQMFFKLINSKTLKFRKRKKLWEKGQDWKHFHKIYGHKNDKTIKCFIKLLIYIERKENLVEESHQDYDEDYDYSLDEASDCDDEHHEDNDEKDEDEIDSDNDHDGYQSHGEEYEDLMARVDLLREKMKMSMVVYVDSPQDFKMQPPSLEDILESTSGKILITDGSSRETSQSEGVKDSSNDVYNNHNEEYFKLEEKRFQEAGEKVWCGYLCLFPVL